MIDEQIASPLLIPEEAAYGKAIKSQPAAIQPIIIKKLLIEDLRIVFINMYTHPLLYLNLILYVLKSGISILYSLLCFTMLVLPH